MNKPSVTIFGLGRVGFVLKKALEDSGYQIKSTYSRNEFPKSMRDFGEIVFLAVPDKEVERLAQKIAYTFSNLEEKVFVHCSGALSSLVLHGTKKNGAEVASFHPLKAVTGNQSSFRGSWFDIEGDSKAVNMLNVIASDLKAFSFDILSESKPLLHAAAVVSSNYLVTLMKLAVDISTEAGIEKSTALKALLSLAESSISNIKENGLEDALTGPISRGDVETIEQHIMELNNHPELLKHYKSLGTYTLSLAKDLSEEKHTKLKEILKDGKT